MSTNEHLPAKKLTEFMGGTIWLIDDRERGVLIYIYEHSESALASISAVK